MTQDRAQLEEHAKTVAQLTADFFGIPMPELVMTDKNKGFAFAYRNLVEIPYWPARHGEHYFTAYVVHEVTHLYRFSLHKDRWYSEPSHGTEFHTSERLALAQWGLEPVYARAYIKELRYNGQVVFNRAVEHAKIRAQVLAKLERIETRAPRPRARKETPLELILKED
jgi:hypothetical protein